LPVLVAGVVLAVARVDRDRGAPLGADADRVDADPLLLGDLRRRERVGVAGVVLAVGDEDTTLLFVVSFSRWKAPSRSSKMFVPRGPSG
jgi:hypothetical protein